MPAGAMAFPLSGGSFEYDDTTGLLEIAGMNNMGGFFNESLHVFERENDHFHVNYSNNIWELVRDGS
jgi:hypothetical protein